MKNWLLVLPLLFLLNTSWSQQAADTSKVPVFTLLSGQIAYTDSVRLDGNHTKDQLFGNVHSWYHKNYESNDNIISVDNTTDGMFSGTGIIHRNAKEEKADPGDISFAIDIHIIPNGYTYRVYGLMAIEDGNKFSYSDMYYEERFPLDKTQWNREYRHRKLIYMDWRVKQMLDHLKDSMDK